MRNLFKYLILYLLFSKEVD